MMDCFKCGFTNLPSDRFCKKCGAFLESNYSESINNINQVQQPIDNTSNELINNQQFNSTSVNSNCNYVNKEATSNMTKWAILSIIVPIVAIIWYWFIGLSTLMAIVIAALGFEFSKRGELTNKKLANVGKIFNGIFVGIIIIMFIINLAIALTR